MPNPSTEPSRRHALAAALFGPLLIVAAVLVALRAFAFEGKLTEADVRTIWLPTYCYLGKALAAGHVPAWTPYTVGGVPFASDPQSGWMHLAPMALFAALPCGAAIRSMIVLHPLLAGLGLYAFLRVEGLGRPAATVGGLSLALLMARSVIAVQLPFAGTLASTVLALAAAAKLVRAERVPSRLGWTLAVAVAWGQVASAHLSTGLIVGSAAIGAYLTAKAAALLRSGRWRGRDVASVYGVLALSVVAVNVAVVLPRLLELPSRDLADGYRELSARSALLTGRATPPFPGRSLGPLWPANLPSASDLSAGAIVLAASAAGWWGRRRRHLAAAFTLFAGACYLATLTAVVERVPESLGGARVVDMWLHEPYRFLYGVLLAVPVLGALGIQSFLEAPPGPRRWLPLALAGAAILATAIGVHGSWPRVALLVAGGGLAAGALTLSSRRPALAAAVPLLLAAELLVRPAAGGPATLTGGLPYFFAFQRSPRPIAELTAEGPIPRAIERRDDGRVYSLGNVMGPRDAVPRALRLGESLLFRLEGANGYEPLAPDRVWTLIRAVQGLNGIKYSYSLFTSASPVLLDLFQVRWLVGREDDPSLAGRSVVARDGPWALVEPPDVVPRASVLRAWTVAPSRADALRVVAEPGFDPSRQMVLEQDPLIEPSPSSVATGTATYTALGDQAARIEVSTAAPALVLIRNAWDRNWRATVDGRPVPLLAADTWAQAVAVGVGTHTIELRFDDPAIGWSLLGSVLAVAALSGWGIALAIRARSRRVAERR